LPKTATSAKTTAMRFLYLLNLETGDRAEETDVSGLRPMEIIALESRLWAKIEDPWVVRDSALDPPTTITDRLTSRR
jgi:hypothetical protein